MQLGKHANAGLASEVCMPAKRFWNSDDSQEATMRVPSESKIPHERDKSMRSTAAAAVKGYDAFRKRSPYQLIPTNIPGVFTSPAPPEGFDPKTASAVSLVKHGLLWRRPGKSDHPGVIAAWEKLSSRRWLAKDRIVPFLQPQPGKTHHLKGRRKTNAGNQNAWSGGSVKGQWATCVGTWVIPTVSQPSEGQGQEGGWNSSSWAGIDGAYSSNDVLQAGVEQKVDGNGKASYIAWFEWFGPGQVGGTSGISRRTRSYWETRVRSSRPWP